MPKAYIFIYSQRFGDREFVKGVVNRIPEITNWRYDLPNTFYLVSELSADELAKRVTEVAGKKARHLITELSENSQGLLPRKTWHLLNEKEHLRED
jgi:hypothetical protein